MKVKALKKTYYAGRDRLVGDEFEMDDREEQNIKILLALGSIEKVETSSTPPAPSPPSYRTAAMTAAPKAPVIEEPKQDEPKVMTTENTESLVPRRVYRRRDMKAEE